MSRFLATTFSLMIALPSAALAAKSDASRFYVGIGLSSVTLESDHVGVSLLPSSGQIGVDLMDGQLGMVVDFDIAHSSFMTEIKSGGTSSEENDSTLRWNVGLSLRHNFRRPEANSLVPSLRLRGFYGQSIVTDGASAAAGTSATSTEDTTNAFGASLAYGLEYVFTDHFGLAGELGFSFTRTTNSKESAGTTTDVSANHLSNFVNLFATFRW